MLFRSLPVRLIANGGGGVYAPLGPTHLAIEDIAIMRALPHMTVVAPCDADEMRRFMHRTLEWPHPIYIRLGKGGDKVVSDDAHGFEIGRSIRMRDGADGLFVTTGVMTQIALEAAAALEGEGLRVGVRHVHTIKPLDVEGILGDVARVPAVVTVEEGIVSGGLGTAVLEACSDEAPADLPKVARIGIPDAFPTQYGSQQSLLSHWGITAASLADAMRARRRAAGAR